MTGFNICGMVVRSRDNRADDVRASLLAIPGVEIHSAETGRMVVTVEDESYSKVADNINSIQYIDGVVSASLVYQYSDQQDTQQESEQ
ncbi:MAG: chaperone NapD [Arenicellales bacterium]|jgi:nitrate reductase NapD